MRKLSFIVFALVLLAACNRNEENILPFNPDDVTFYATNADLAETKTVLQADGTIQWLPKDEINVFYSQGGSARFVSDNTEKAAQVAFKGALKDFTYKDGASFWAVYPYRESHTFSGEALTVSLPANQMAVAGSFADDLFVSIARTTNFNLQFYNVCGGIEFSVTEPGVKTVTFRGNGDEPLAGTAKVGFGADGKPVIQNVTDAATTITLTMPDGSAFQTGAKYYIALWPAALENGYKITLTKEDGTSTVKKNSKSVTVKRAVWGVLENLDKGLSYELRVPDNEIWYTSTDGEIVTPFEDFGVVSNTYTDGKGRMVFDHPLTEIPGFSFSGVQNLETISLPESVTEILGYAFQETTGLFAIEMPGVKVIGTRAFSFSGLTGVLDLPETLQTIGSEAFEYCKGITEIIIPKNVKSIGVSAFLSGSFTKLVLKPLIPPTLMGLHYAPYTIDVRDELWKRKCLICVPEESLEAYQTDDRWRDVNAYLTVEGKMPSECYYTSKDYSLDGEVVFLEHATVGKGINLVFLGDGYVDRDLVPGGKFEQRVRTEVEHLFTYEPFKSFRNRFNIILVNVVSKNEVYYSPFGAERRLTYDRPDETLYDPLLEICDEYAANVTESDICVAVLLNKFPDREGGFCTFTSWHPVRSLAFCPNIHDYEDDSLNDHRLFTHEFGGHGFGMLEDEYGGVGRTFPEDLRQALDYEWNENGFGVNVDWRNDPNIVHWSHFLKDSRYSEEALGVYEGAVAYDYKVYRCSEESIMNGTGGREIAPKHLMWFNAPSREQIYKRMMKLSVGDDWVYDYETFVQEDAAGREQAATRYQEFLRICEGL